MKMFESHLGENKCREVVIVLVWSTSIFVITKFEAGYIAVAG